VNQERFPVVLVDDADDVRAVVGARLRLSRHFEVVGEGASGADAIALATAHRPALMVLDASMPDMDGLEALPATLEAWPATRVVMFSGFGGPALEAAARELGAADFVEKATPLRELPDRLLRVLGAGPSAGGPSPDSPEAAGESAPADAPGQAEETELAEHLERFRTVFDQAAIGMATMTLAGTVVRVNPALVRLTGQAEDRLIGRRYSDLTGSGADGAVREALARVAGGRDEMAQVEHRLQVRGTTAWFRSTVTVVRDPAGRPLYLFAQAEDITDQRRVVEELRLSEERFRLLVESVMDYAIFMLDPDGYVTTWNTGAERMKGYKADEIIGQHFRTFYPPEMQALRHPEHELEIAVREGRYEEEGWRIRKDGTAFWANVVITALFDHDHHLVGFGKVTRDITERRQAEAARDRAAAELAEINERLRAANEETGDFLAITAHELHSPVTAMTGAAELLADHWDDLGEADRAENFQNLTRSARRTRRLLDELLMASRLEAGQLEVRVEPVALGPAIAEAVAGAEQPVTVAGGDDAVEVRADRVRIVQILGNLLANAARYGEPPITVESRVGDDAVEIRVCDAGRGVPADLEPRLFRKFVRGAGRRDRGTGLGLFIVRELSRRQGGDAWYERDADGRPCFCFTLPRAG
jgi:PAS domain S-box-containing protein